MKRLILICFLIGLMHPIHSQTPNGFNYQAVIRDSQGDVIMSQAVTLRITLQSNSGTEYYKETHSTTTSPQGVVNLTIGLGAINQGTISNVPWQEGDIFLKLEVDPAGGSNYSAMGVVKLQAVPYALFANSAREISAAAGGNEEDPLFVVRNSVGQIVFAVYESGVRIYVEDDDIKGSRGGFAIGGLSDQTKEEPIEFMRVTPDSVRINIKTQPYGDKGSRGGFAIGGLSDQTKLEPKNLMFIAPDSARIWVNSEAAKGAKGGFAVGGYSGKGSTSNFMLLTPDNYLIGHEAGAQTTIGLYNSFFGYHSGYSNTEGSYNVFMGRNTGYSNISGFSNVFIGDNAGHENQSGYANVLIGDQSGASNTTGYWNIFLGRYSGYNNISGSANLFAGDFAGYSNTTGYSNVFLGDYTGGNNTEGYENVFLGKEAGLSNTTGYNNVFLGVNSGNNNIDGYWNIFLGRNSGYSNLSGSANFFAGDYAGYSNTTGTYNIFLGDYAGGNNTEGYQNIFIGKEAGWANSMGNYNVFAGSQSGYFNEDGEQNSLFGSFAGHSNTTGSFNSFFGSQSGYYNTIGEQNVMIGQEAGFYNETGGWNVFVGSLSGYNNTSGSANVAIGDRAGFNNEAGDFNVFIGQQAGFYETGSNKLYISNSDANSANAMIYGEFNQSIEHQAMRINGRAGIGGPWNSNYALYVTGNALATGNWYISSDSRWKTNVKKLDNALRVIQNLQGVSYNWRVKDFPDKKFSAETQIGFIAQDVETIIPEVVSTDDKGYKSIDYSRLTPHIVEAIKEQQKIIEQQNIAIDRLEKDNKELKKKFVELTGIVEKVLMENKSKMEPPKKATSTYQE